MTPGPKPRKDAIWLGVARNGVAEEPLYLRNRAVAEAALVALIEQEKAAGTGDCWSGLIFPLPIRVGLPKR